MTKSAKKVLIALLFVVFVFAFALGLYQKPTKSLADSQFITMREVAQVRIVSDEGDGLANSGLKFNAQVEKSAYDALVDTYESVEAGIIIVPEDYVEAAGGYTLEKLGAFSVLDGKVYYKITEGFSLNEDNTHYIFANSIINIKPANYNRNFASVAFIKIIESDPEKATQLAEYDLYDDAYYIYSNLCTANVYDVAYQTFENYYTSDEEACAILKKYLDNVAVISGNDGKVEISNNGGEYYQSPFAIGKSIDGYYFIQQSPTAMTYNGERIKTLSVVDYVNKVKIYTDAVSNFATFNTDGTVTLEGKLQNQGIGWAAISKNYDNSYIAFEGNYGVGTYIDFTFKGNNLPQVTLFANEINGNITCGNTSADDYNTNGPKNTGFLIMNGMYTKTAWSQATGDVYSVSNGDRIMLLGPYRMHGATNFNMNTSSMVITSTVNEFEQNYLSTDTSGTEYKYTVGSFVQDGVVYIEISITNLTTNVTQTKLKSTGLSKAECEALGGNIIAFGCCKEDVASATTFKYSAPYQKSKDDVVSSGATFNYDGSVTLEGKLQNQGLGWVAISKSYENSYIAFEGNYGVGTYVDFTFVGNNLPQVTLFANEINGNMTCGNTSADDYNTNGPKNTGFLIMNGMYTKTAWSQATGDVYSVSNGDRIMLLGPYRMHGATNFNMNTSSMVITSTVNEFEQNYLSTDTSGTEYKYTVGSFVQDGVVYIEISITNLTTNVTQTKLKSTGLSKAECEALGGNIIAFGCVKEDYASGTTFKFSAPYTK